jgi:ketosteroid isomerase-like protein
MVIVVAGCLGSSALAGEWSAAQKEIWKTVEAYNAAFDKGDLEGFMAYFHNDYNGWAYSSPVPNGKATVRKFVDIDMKSSKNILSHLEPVGINIFGNTAVVHYYFFSLSKDMDGKTKENKGRWTDVLMKQGDKWMLVGDHGGSSRKDD